MLAQLLPLILFMLIPVWIPVATITVGAVADTVRRALGHTPEPTVAESLRTRRATGAHTGTARPESAVIAEAA